MPERRDEVGASGVHDGMLVPVSGFGKGDRGLELDVERMANGNMADGKCGLETKAPEKTGALQKLRRFGWCIRHSMIFAVVSITAESKS